MLELCHSGRRLQWTCAQAGYGRAGRACCLACCNTDRWGVVQAAQERGLSVEELLFFQPGVLQACLMCICFPRGACFCLFAASCQLAKLLRSSGT